MFINIKDISINYRLIARVTHVNQMLRVKKVLVPKDTVAFVQRDIMEIIVNWVRKNRSLYALLAFTLRAIICNPLLFIHLAYLNNVGPFLIMHCLTFH